MECVRYQKKKRIEALALFALFTLVILCIIFFTKRYDVRKYKDGYFVKNKEGKTYERNIY